MSNISNMAQYSIITGYVTEIINCCVSPCTGVHRIHIGYLNDTPYKSCRWL